MLNAEYETLNAVKTACLSTPGNAECYNPLTYLTLITYTFTTAIRFYLGCDALLMRSACAFNTGCT